MYVDVAALLAGGLNPPEPDILPLTDDAHLFYRGEFNLIFGDSESGKTWLTLAAIADVLTAQEGRAAFIDLDHNGASAIIGRLRSLGVPDRILVDTTRFRLTQDDGIHLKAIVQDLAVFEPDVVVLDSLGEALGLFKYNSNDAEDFTQAHTLIIKPLTEAGCGVLVIDHLAKNTDSRAFGPTGTPAKLRAVGGTAIRVTATEPFRPGAGGTAKLELFKDRHGGVRSQFPGHDPKPVVGTFRLTSHGDTLTHEIEPSTTVPQSGQQTSKTAEKDAQKLYELLGGADMPLSLRSVRSVLKCGQPRAQRAIAAYQDLMKAAA